MTSLAMSPLVQVIVGLQAGVILVLAFVVFWLVLLAQEGMVQARRRQALLDAVEEVDRIGEQTRTRLRETARR